jgi:hypothetical protein
MTIEEARSLMLTVDELREIYEQVKRTGEPQRLYLLEGDQERGIAIDLTPKCVLGSKAAVFIAAESRDNDAPCSSDEKSDTMSEFGERFYANSGDAYHGLHFLGWACFRTKADADAWEAATLGRNDET